MRILHIAPGCPFTESYKYQENLLTEYQKKLGHEVILMTTTLTRDECGKLTAVEREDCTLDNGVRLIRFFKLNKLNRITGSFGGVYKKICELSPDFIFVHGLCTYSMKYAVKYRKAHPGVYIVADNHQDEFNEGDKKWLTNLEHFRYRSLWKKWVESVDIIYGTTSWRVPYAIKEYGIPEDKVRLLIMGVDSDNMEPDQSEVRREIRNELGIPQDAFVFVSGGQLNRHKLITESLQEFDMIDDTKAYFVLFGKMSEDIQIETEELISSNDRIKYLGFIDGRNIYRYLYASDFGVFPGRHSVIWEEAVGCALPCVFRKYEESDHTDVCGNCVRLEKPDGVAIGEIMKKALRDPQWYGVLKRNAEKARNAFSYRTIAEQSLECAFNGERD